MTAHPLPPARPLAVGRYLELPEDGEIRHELQEGILVTSPGPVAGHQICLPLPGDVEPVPGIDVDLQLVASNRPGFVPGQHPAGSVQASVRTSVPSWPHRVWKEPSASVRR